jgi:hypothetical protein
MRGHSTNLPWKRRKFYGRIGGEEKRRGVCFREKGEQFPKPKPRERKKMEK